MANEIRPWYRWWWHRYRTSVRVLKFKSMAVHGAYRNLLDAMWEQGGTLPTDREVLWRLALAYSCEEYEQVADEVEAMFEKTEDGQSFTNNALTKEWEDSTNFLAKKRESGKASGRARRNTARTETNTGGTNANTSGTNLNTSGTNPNTGPTSSTSSSKISSKSRNKKDFCGEPNKSDSPPPKIVCRMPLNDGSEFDVLKTDVDIWQELYPAVDVVQQLREMKGWCLANPERRKTKTGVKKFINSWLAKEQNSSRGRVNGDGNGKFDTRTKAQRDQDATVEAVKGAHRILEVALGSTGDPGGEQGDAADGAAAGGECATS